MLYQTWMHAYMKRLLAFFVFSSILFLTACGGADSGGSSSSNTNQTISGTAATGLAIDGTVYAKDRYGVEKSVGTNPDGSFELYVSGMTGPFMLKVVNSYGDTYYSYASTNNQLDNITPLSNLAMFVASGKSDLGAIYDSWDGATITASSILNAQAVINANLANEMNAAGLDPSTYNFITQPFNADGTGFDSVLDQLAVSVDPGAGTFSVTVAGNSSFNFDEMIDTSSFNIDSGITAVSQVPPYLTGAFTLRYVKEVDNTNVYTGDGDTGAFFTIAGDGTLTINDGSNVPSAVLTNPVFKSAVRNGYDEVIWYDGNIGLHYELLLTPGTPNSDNPTQGYGMGIVLSNDKLPGDGGYQVYGRYSLRNSGKFIVPIDQLIAMQGVYYVSAVTNSGYTGPTLSGTITIDAQGGIDLGGVQYNAADYSAIYSGDAFDGYTAGYYTVFPGPYPSLYPRITFVKTTDYSQLVLVTYYKSINDRIDLYVDNTVYIIP